MGKQLLKTLALLALLFLSSHAAEKPPNIHHPFTPHPRFKGTSQCGLYGDFIHELDWIVGEVMKTLDDLDLAENTLVIFTSDNGGMINQGGQEAVKQGHRLNGDPLGFKFDAWEGGHRVPFIARWPGKIGAGSVSDQLICNVDLLATLADLTGIPLAIAYSAGTCMLIDGVEVPIKKIWDISGETPQLLYQN